MNDKYTDKQLKKKFGMRPLGTPVDFPQEFGYRCPCGHSNLTWSEFNEFIWCFTCKKDFHYVDDCILVEDKSNPEDLPKQPRIIKGINNWTEDGNGFIDVPLEIIEENEVK